MHPRLLTGNPTELRRDVLLVCPSRISAMLRSLFLSSSLILGLAFGASAQVVVNGGYATTYPVAVPPNIANTVSTYDIPSVPAINTPVAHVGPTAEQAAQPQGNLSPALPIVTAGAPENNATQAATPNTTAQSNGFNFGVATYPQNPFSTPGAGTNGESLGQVSRQYKQKGQQVDAKVYTNADIEKLQGNTYGGAAAIATNNDNWPANNGVITQQPVNAEPPSVAAPAQNQSTTGTVPGSSPFSPKPESNGTPTPQPQSMNQKPSPDHPVEMAQNNSANADIPQNAGQSTPSDNVQSNAAESTSNNPQKTLPKTASRLPLLGVLGFFSVSVGMFVRHQRSKTARKLLEHAEQKVNNGGRSPSTG